MTTVYVVVRYECGDFDKSITHLDRAFYSKEAAEQYLAEINSKQSEQNAYLKEYSAALYEVQEEYSPWKIMDREFPCPHPMKDWGEHCDRKQKHYSDAEWDLMRKNFDLKMLEFQLRAGKVPYEDEVDPYSNYSIEEVQVS
jgi:hypothetical protein